MGRDSNTDLLGRYARLVANVGFPIMVAAYVLWRLESKLDALGMEIHNLALVTARFCGGQ